MDEIKRFFQISKNDAVALRALALRIHQAEETKNEAAAEVWRKHFSDIAVDVITLGFARRQVTGLEEVAQKILEAHAQRPINAYSWADDALEIYTRMEEVLGSYRPGSMSGSFQMQLHADAATSKGPAKSLVFIPA